MVSLVFHDSSLLDEMTEKLIPVDFSLSFKHPSPVWQKNIARVTCKQWEEWEQNPKSLLADYNKQLQTETHIEMILFKP